MRVPDEQALTDWERTTALTVNPIEPTLVERVLMRDGVRLYTEVLLPHSASDDCFPVILMRGPYPKGAPSKNGGNATNYLEAGYAVVFQLTRGQGQSEGDFHLMSDEVQDGFDCIHWIAEQPWCNSHIGMAGGSYLGSTQLLAAKSKPAALKCIMPTSFPRSFATFPYMNGVLMRGMLLQWYKLVDAESRTDLDIPFMDMGTLDHPVLGPAYCKRPLVDAANEWLSGDKLASWKAIVVNPSVNKFWQQGSYTDKTMEDILTELDIPIFITYGWFDDTIGCIDAFEFMERQAPGKGDRYLLVGPWDHYQCGSKDLHYGFHGARAFPDNGKVDLMALRLAFFDRYLKGKTGNVLQPNRVRVFITGADVWKNYPTFPAPGMEEQKLFLHSNGILNGEAPLDEQPDGYTYDPNQPTLSEAQPISDRREIEARDDVLTYTSAPLDKPLAILGEIKLVLYGASDGLDTDWFARVTEVFPDGRSVAFHGTWPALRARYYQGLDRETLLIPNTPTEFHIPLGPAGHQIAQGNCLRLAIYSAEFPLYDTNTNTGNDVARDTETRVAENTVYHDTCHPSHLVLPTISLTM